MHTIFGKGNVRGRGDLEDIVVGGKVILKYIFKEG
jgi:hypothetical protein